MQSEFAIDPDAVVDRALVTLLAGESARFAVIGATNADDSAFIVGSVPRSANVLVQN
ncbi:hypothetical protein [Microbacterium atlanticum]|uniref:hypothetical protein n=1 Tax=Microbacterium atlanticum TaxID=2782168 RepID=UPI001E5E0453|nr:hypothetical protein [Microbacterium atlanticum]